ncbi:MAG: hypothetical protein KGJ73_04220, partial [Rhodospirillales bacterium]|nr:hypothetical protein [Rhodospirillales bacterium]
MESWPNYDGGATGKRFYSYVNGDPINNVDPLGLWEVSAYAGDGAAAEINFGYNNGQWNFGAYGGVGVGAGVDYNGSPEAEQCQSPGIHELGVQAQA